MDSLMSGIAIVALIINIIVLISFFQLVRSVSDIRYSVAKTGQLLETDYQMHMAYGDNEKALVSLQKIIWEKYVMMTSGHKRGKYPKWLVKNLDKLREEYEPLIISLGGRYPNLT